MKKKYLIIAIIAFSFFAGNTNVQAQVTKENGVVNKYLGQDTTMKFCTYLTKTSWVVGVGPDFIDNNNDRNPFHVNNKIGSPSFNTPARYSIEKDIYGFRHWKYTKGFSVLLVVTSTSIRPHNFTSEDLYLKYDLNTLIGDTKFFDPYALIGGGLSYMDYSGPTKDNFGNFNAGLGFNLWIFKNVGINFQSVAKIAVLKSTFQGTNYFQDSFGLVFKIGGNKEEEVKVPVVSTYKRSKEAEDALIHLREHINK